MNLPHLLTVLAIQWAWLPLAIRCWHSNYHQLSTRMHEQSDRSAILNRRADLLWATLGEGGLILVLGAIGWATKRPLIFASLGPTAYELVEQPQLKSARSYNIVVGHLIGMGAGFFAIYLFNAWTAPNDQPPLPRSRILRDRADVVRPVAPALPALSLLAGRQ